MCVCGEIGKHSRLKICRPQGPAGSSPARRTNSFILRKYNSLFWLGVNQSMGVK